VQRRRWLNRFKALPTGQPLRRKRAERKPPKDTGPSLRVRRLVAKRAENRCEYPMCGDPPAAELPVHTSHYSVPVYLNFDGTWTPIEIPDETAGEESKKAA
jgi:hypothetical protein